MANLESIFEKWLETGELTPSERQLLEQDAVYAEMLENSETWQSLSAKYQETPVPQWNREATWFEKTSDGAKINRFAAWFAPAALACSVLMCSLVIMRAEVSVSDSGFAINFAEQQKQAPTVTYEQLQTLLAEQQTNTAQATYALVKEAIEQGRVERKEDIGALVADLNRVRQQDQALIRLQLNELAQQVEQQPQSSIAKNHSWEN